MCRDLEPTDCKAELLESAVMMTQDVPEDPDDDGGAVPAAPLEGAEMTLDVVTLEAFLDALRQASPPEGRVVPFPRKPIPPPE